ncbi:MAG TPA: nucleotidyltransferase family protein [Steroidobacteraceae bacterium]|nr:nucleotidyltransferase family protein [Steroidobacteraceae bacterium]
MKAMVLAAGRGERMRPLTDSTPKPLLEVGGKPLIGHLLEALARAGIREVVINLSWLGERIRARLKDGAQYGVEIAYSEEGPVALETGGGIVHALPLLGNAPFIVASGDIWSDFDFGSLELATAADAQLVMVPNPAHHPRGDFGLEGERVVARATERLTYANIGVYRREIFSDCPAGRFPLIEVLERSIALGRVRGRIHRGEWLNIGTPEQLAALDAQLRRAARPA